MKSEHEFNEYVTAQIKKMGTSYKVVKVSDRFHLGASDWMIYHAGRAVAVEAKFAKKIKGKGSVLSHKVSGPQRTFLKSMELAGVPGWIFLGVGSPSSFAIIPAYLVSEEGQLVWEDILTNTNVKWAEKNAVSDAIRFLFGEISRDAKGNYDEIRAADCPGDA